MTELTQTQLSERLGVPSGQIAPLRREHLSSADYRREGRKIFYTEDAARKLEAALIVKDEIPEAVPRFVEVFVLGPAANRKFMKCILVGDDGVRRMVAVRIPPRLTKNPRLLPRGKRIRAQEVEVNGEKFYRHELLCR